MSIYRCALCEELKDADYDECFEHPDDECECICENCFSRFPEYDFCEVDDE